ncbi:hypothetical protein HHI36_009630 [Cryptolaemus montrouzieri]|uniref:Uncharacterized protein n=1 Tax=Cryptolaemus montrouzieri TaxID=559131 RepID=A0ABD2MGC6_9CUCU
MDLLVYERRDRHRFGIGKEELRESTFRKWQDRWEEAQDAAWTRKLINNLRNFTERKFGEVGLDKGAHRSWMLQLVSCENKKERRNWLQLPIASPFQVCSVGKREKRRP